MQKSFTRADTKVIERFKNEIFPLNYDEEEEQEFREKEKENDLTDENGLIDCETNWSKN